NYFQIPYDIALGDAMLLEPDTADASNWIRPEKKKLQIPKLPVED
ncbi:jg13034, partial [Pararge aegeria aegeria]